ncbi:MAG: heavy metal translocating P-type ATPase, partial [Candidatus Phytoplasma sp.]|nr:heavy metal translocating P-type ATPase [Phytoplasma sp.]
SLNIMETILVKVTKVGSETVLAKIIQTVEETSLIKPKAQRIADKIASVFVPVVILISIIVLISWLFIQGATLSQAISPAIAVLVVSCPCALGLATPTSISVSSGMAFKEGVLYKGGEFFEIANKITAIAFDKTGTLTNGKPVVTDYIGTQETLIYTASLEKHSNHPIASAITSYFKGEILSVEGFETLIGYGIKGYIENREVLVVSISYLNENQIKNPYLDYEQYQEQGKTVFFTVVDRVVVNMIAVSDELKESSYALIKDLKARGITPYMITGDQMKTALYIGGLLGIEQIYAGVLPHEKAEIVKKIQEKEKVVAFVGDGINDAPALKMADVGFAVGSGSDIAIDTADVTLMKNDLHSVLYAIDLSRATLHNIYLNFFWAFIYNIVLIPLAAFNTFSPTLAGFGMAFSSLMVILNALSLKLWKFKTKEDV